MLPLTPAMGLPLHYRDGGPRDPRAALSPRVRGEFLHCGSSRLPVGSAAGAARVCARVATKLV